MRLSPGLSFLWLSILFLGCNDDTSSSPTGPDPVPGSSSSSLNSSSSQIPGQAGAMLEPAQGVLHCAGQSDADFADYTALMGSENPPAVTMHYFGLKNWWTDAPGWAQSVQTQLDQYPDNYLAVQVGLSLTVDGKPTAHYEGEVASGALDKEIDALLDALETLAHPVYLRIGYEFNGLSWNGYQPETYKSAFKHIAEKVRARNLEVALVWDAAAGGTSNIMDFYPGDEYVDWWGINWFQPSQIGNTLSQTLLTKAKEHNKPVMIGESSPAGLGTKAGQERWNTWFAPYFQQINENPQIKMFCYINTDWTAYPDFPQWKSWGDARLQNDTLVTRLYRTEITSSRYLHGGSENKVRSYWYPSDGTAPTTVTGLALTDTLKRILTWNPVSDASSYAIEKDGKIFARTRETRYQIDNQPAGSTAKYTVLAVNKAGIASAPSNTITLSQADSLEKISNGNFAQGLQSWYLLKFEGAGGTLTASTDAEGNSNAQVTITKATGTNWHLQFAQSIQLHSDMGYLVRFRARSSTPTQAEVLLQQQSAPYAVYGSLKMELGTDWQTYEFSTIANAGELSRLTFMLGAS